MSSTAVEIAGHRLTVFGNPDDPYFQQAGIHASMQVPMAELAQREAGPGLVVDIGANIGLSTMALALLRPGSAVVAVEPSAVNAAFLRQNLAANGLGRVEVVEAAVSDQPGTTRFLHNGPWSHMVGAGNIEPGLQGPAVRVATLDGLLAGRGTVAFVKIDTEGCEPQVLHGGRQVLERDRPLLAMEFNSWCLAGVSGASPAAFAQSLWRAFEVRRLDERGTLWPPDANVHAFLLGNMTQRGLVDDLVMQLRPGASVPSLEHMTVLASYADELHRLRAEAASLRASTSWRLTAPLRGVARGVRAFRNRS